MTGNPVRASVVAVERHPSPDRPLVAVFGGSLGARRINEAAVELRDLWRDRAGVAVRHISGPSGHEATASALAVASAIQCPYCIDAYTQSCLEKGSNLEQMTEALHVASAIRGGASLVHGLQMRNCAAKVSM